MFKKIKTDNFYLYSTEVENFFISDFMINAPGEYVKAYLLALMYAQLGVSLDSESIRRQLSLTEEDMDSCWEYWEGLGIVRRISEPGASSYDVEFVNLRELTGKMAVATEKHVESSLDEKELALLYRDVQKATGRMIDGREMQEIVSWINDYNYSPELILFCYKYCASKRKSSAYRYVAAVLKDWKAKDIKTAEDAESFLGENDSRFNLYKEIFSELGFSRNPTAEEKRFMNDWFDRCGFSLKEILEACKQTVAISNPNLKYVDAVLKNLKGQAPESAAKESVAVQINRIYENIRKENEEKTRQRKAFVFSKIPSLESIIKEQGALGLKQTQAMLRRDSASLANYKEKARALAEEKSRLLKEAGFSPDALDSIYTCPKCKDTGVLEDGSPCSCYAEKLEQINGQS